MKAVPTKPITPGSIQVFTPMSYEIWIKKGQRALPIMPIALTQPYPRLRTLVG